MTLLDIHDDILRNMCEVLKELTDQPCDYTYGNIAASVLQQLDLARSSARNSPSIDACDEPYGAIRPLPLSFYRAEDVVGAIYSRPQSDNEMFVCEFANEGVEYQSPISPTNPSVASRGIEALNGYWPALKLLVKLSRQIDKMALENDELDAIRTEVTEFLTPREGPKIVRIV